MLPLIAKAERLSLSRSLSLSLSLVLHPACEVSACKLQVATLQNEFKVVRNEDGWAKTRWVMGLRMAGGIRGQAEERGKEVHDFARGDG